MRPPSPLLILLYITLSKSQRVVSKRGSGTHPSRSESLRCVQQRVCLILRSTEVATNKRKRTCCPSCLFVCVTHFGCLMFCNFASRVFLQLSCMSNSSAIVFFSCFSYYLLKLTGLENHPGIISQFSKFIINTYTVRWPSFPLLNA